MEYQNHKHEFPPVWDSNSEILILGSFPSVKSREEGFFYGHPRNRFWDVISAVLQCPKPGSVEEKRRMLLSGHIAVWDVIASCQIKGSSDSSIRNVVANDLSEILYHAPIRMILANGKTAEKLYNKYIFPNTGRPVTVMPSTSPANAAWSLDRLVEVYQNTINNRLNLPLSSKKED